MAKAKMTCDEFVTQKMENLPGLLDLLNKRELIHAFAMAYQAGYDEGYEAGLTLQGSGDNTPEAYCLWRQQTLRDKDITRELAEKQS